MMCPHELHHLRADIECLLSDKYAWKCNNEWLYAIRLCSQGPGAPQEVIGNREFACCDDRSGPVQPVHTVLCWLHLCLWHLYCGDSSRGPGRHYMALLIHTVTNEWTVFPERHRQRLAWKAIEVSHPSPPTLWDTVPPLIRGRAFHVDAIISQ